jgi:p-aminobenzoyl-glutamate transporter AbgT
MVAFWDVLALVLLLVSISFLVLTVVLVVALLWTRKFQDSSQESEKTATRVRTFALAMAGVIFLILAVVVLLSKHPTLSFDHDKSDTLTAVGTVSGDVVTAIIAGTTLYALILLRRAVAEQVKQLKASAVQNVGQEMLKIDRWMADNPCYVKAVGNDQHTALGAAVAEVHADLIAQVLSQSEYLPPEHMTSWEEYFQDIIRMWPQLKKFIEDHGRWYQDAEGSMARILSKAAAASSSASTPPRP